MDTGDDPVDGDLRREHWIVPVQGASHADPDGVVQAVARRDGSVIVYLTCGSSRAGIRLDVSRAAQLCTGIWEAAGVAQQLRNHPGETPPPPLPAPQDPPVSECSVLPQPAVPPRAPAPRRSPPRRQRHPAPVHHGARRAIGLRIRWIRHQRGKSLQVIGGLAGMSSSKLHCIEHGQRDLKLPDLIALAHALQVTPETLIRPASTAATRAHPATAAS